MIRSFCEVRLKSESEWERKMENVSWENEVKHKWIKWVKKRA